MRINQTRTGSRWGTIANPHAKVFDPPAPQVPPLGHDPGNRMKIMLYDFSIFICKYIHKVWYKKSLKLTW